MTNVFIGTCGGFGEKILQGMAELLKKRPTVLIPPGACIT
jgi:hypothetical protein